MATFSEAKFYWPWEKPQHYRLHSPHAKAKPNLAGHVNRDDAPNCDQINSAIKTLNPDNYERSMRTSSKKQKEYIALCQEKKNP